MLDMRCPHTLHPDSRNQPADAHKPCAHLVGQGVKLPIDGRIQSLDVATYQAQYYSIYAIILVSITLRLCLWISQPWSDTWAAAWSLA